MGKNLQRFPREIDHTDAPFLFGPLQKEWKGPVVAAVVDADNLKFLPKPLQKRGDPFEK